MEDLTSHLIDVGELRRGMYIQLDLGWMDHPFPRGSFKITSDEQVRTIRALGVAQVRFFPGRSERGGPRADHERAADVPTVASGEGARGSAHGSALQLQRSQRLWTQQELLRQCELRFQEGTQLVRRVLDEVDQRPQQMREACQQLVGRCVTELLADGEATIRLLGESSGDRQTTHSVNVMVLALLLGRALRLGEAEMQDLGVAALLHDLGKLQLPERARTDDERMDPDDRERYRSHVQESVAVGMRMGLSTGALQAIAEHHEMADGTGFPRGLSAGSTSVPGKILALVNRYDSLCNPPWASQAMTPHEALAQIFAQNRARFDSVVLGAFIRMMGVYPPGSVVQLVNDRFAVVVAVNSVYPLRPRVLVHDGATAPEQALILDLQDSPELSIRRSLRPNALPAAARTYLAPSTRVRCFYERARSAGRVNA
jgi:putative nucleotidyltransferase with HDIG domain